MDQPNVWTAVESVAAELQASAAELGREEIVEAIKRGMGR